MKYGDQLRLHSVPEWAYYNVDYDAVKHLIKECTSAGKGKAIDIPGQGDDASANAEKRLHAVLQSEHERVGLFVKSKSNEIQGRLGNLERTLRKLRSRHKNFGSDGPRPYVVQRYGNLEREAITTGEEIRSLSRFIVAQKTAFRKLLKKYKKWSGSTALEDQFRMEVLNRASSFTQVSLADDFDRWMDVLQSIRAAGNPGSLSGSPTVSNVTRSSAARHKASRKAQTASTSVAQEFSQALKTMSDVNFDTAFSEVPMGESGFRAVYWVHSEQLIELQVLLLQHLRLYLTQPLMESSSSFSQSPVVTRRSSLSTKQDGYFERENDTGVIYVDEADSYGERQSRATVGDSENSTNGSPVRTAAAARWASGADDATLAFRPRKKSKNQSLARVRRKHLGALLDAERDFKPWQTSGNATPIDASFSMSKQDTISPTDARQILEENKALQPLVAILSKRTRFVGLENTSTAGQWATLDAQIYFKKVAKEELAGKEWISNLARDAQEFPFAVLRVRQEGKFTKDLIEVLDKSHLTERVRGFSLASHAIWECWRPRGMSPPFWLGAMSKDIRKVPNNITLGRRRSSQMTATEHGKNSSASSNSENERSGFSSTAVAGESSATSIPPSPVGERDFFGGLQPISERKPKRVRIDETTTEKPSRRKQVDSQPRYWNEYDDPSDDDTNGYYIYIDPNKEDKWLGQDTAEKLYAKFHNMFKRDDRKVPDEERGLIRPLTSYEDEEEGNSSSPTDSDADSPVKSITFFPSKPGFNNTNYGSIPGPSAPSKRPNTRLADLLLPPVETTASPSSSSRLLITTLSLTASTILCVLIFTLATTGRKRQKGEVDAGVLLGVIASLFFALVGLTSVMTARETIGLLNWFIISTVFCVVCIIDGVLVGWIFV